MIATPSSGRVGFTHDIGDKIAYWVFEVVYGSYNIKAEYGGWRESIQGDEGGSLLGCTC